MSITANAIRNGNFTSSGIYALMGAPKPYKTYIAEKNMERRLQRSLSMDKDSRATIWGHFLEDRVHALLDASYEQVGDKTIVHEHIPYWCGSPDNISKRQSAVGDTKCYEPKAFCQYVDMLMEGDINLFRSENPKEYWQLISNAVLTKSKYIEPIIYMPYQSELAAIREAAANYDTPEPWKYRFIYESPDNELAYLPDGGYYKNLNIFRFEAPQEDKAALETAVLKAGKLLIKIPEITTSYDIVNGTKVEIHKAA